MLPFLVPVLFTFYIQGVLKNLKNSGAKRLKGRSLKWKLNGTHIFLFAHGISIVGGSIRTIKKTTGFGCG
jgi:hypothetical protein